MKVFVLYYMGPDPNGKWYGKFTGVYSSQQQALRAVERDQGLRGYGHYPQGFQVECVELDEDYEHPEDLGPTPPIPTPPPS